jgi:hypothetical protein
VRFEKGQTSFNDRDCGPEIIAWHGRFQLRHPARRVR